MGAGSRRAPTTDDRVAPRSHRWERAEVGALLAVLAATTGATLLATSRYGIGMTPDSVMYRAGAQSLADGLGFSRHGAAITIWPPGYSAVLSVGERLGLDAADGARLVAVGAFLATTLLGFVLLRRHVRSPGVVIGGTVVIGCSSALLSVFERALSEHLFVVVVLLLLLVAEELIAAPRRTSLVAAATVLVWAAFYLRYAGVVLVPFAAVVVAATAWPLGVRTAALRTTGFTLAALAAPALWMMRNANVGGGALATRRDAEANLLTNVERTARTVLGWITLKGPRPLELLFVLAVLVGVVVVLVSVRPRRQDLARGAREVWPIGLFVVAYVTYLVGTASVVAFEAINTRYVVPVYVPFVVLVAWAFDRLRRRLATPVRVTVTVLAVAWTAFHVAAFADRSLDRERNGAGGYSTTAWHTSELMEDVERWDRSVPLVTNDYNAVDLFTGRYVAESVSKNFGGSAESTGRLPAFVERVRCEGRIALAWFSHRGTRSRLYSPEELAQHMRVVPTAERADGTIYDLTPLPGEEPPAEPACPT